MLPLHLAEDLRRLGVFLLAQEPFGLGVEILRRPSGVGVDLFAPAAGGEQGGGEEGREKRARVCTHGAVRVCPHGAVRAASVKEGSVVGHGGAS